MRRQHRGVNKLIAAPATEGKNSIEQAGCPAKQPKPLPPGFTDFHGLLKAVPLSERSARDKIKQGLIPSIRLPGGRRLLFHLPSVEKALLRFQKGGIPE